MADLQRDAGALGGIDHRLRLLDADRHRLLGQHMLFRRADLRDMLGMQLGRRRHIDRVDIGLAQHRGQIGMRRGAGFRRHRGAHVFGRFRDRHEPELGAHCRIAGRNAKPAAPIPTMPIPIFAAIFGLSPTLVTLTARE